MPLFQAHFQIRPSDGALSQQPIRELDLKMKQVIIYRLAIETILAQDNVTKDFEEISVIGSYLNPSMVASITASCISLVVIIILNIIYNWAALVLTEFEVCSQKNSVLIT